MTQPLTVTPLKPDFLLEVGCTPAPGGLVLTLQGFVGHPEHAVHTIRLNYHTETIAVVRVT